MDGEIYFSKRTWNFGVHRVNEAPRMANATDPPTQLWTRREMLTVVDAENNRLEEFKRINPLRNRKAPSTINRYLSQRPYPLILMPWILSFLPT